MSSKRIVEKMLTKHGVSTTGGVEERSVEISTRTLELINYARVARVRVVRVG
jgi:hypothetical protein